MHPKLQQSKMALILKEPFFAHLALQLKFVADESIPTACTDGVRLKYNPRFVDSLSGPQNTFLICHEVLHCALGHVTRRGGRDPEKWNIAVDFVVNLILKKSQFVFPDGDMVTLDDLIKHVDKQGYLLDTKLDGLSAEEIYSRLPATPPNGGRCIAVFGMVEDPNGKPGDGEGDSDEPGGGGSQPSTIEAKWRVALSQAAQAAKGQGKLPGHLARLVEELLHPKLPWKTLLRQFIRDLTVSDYTWLRPQKGPLAIYDILLPSLKSETCGPIVAVGDTSGSVTPELLAEFNAELQNILDDVKPSTLTVIDCDADVHSATDYNPGDVMRPEWRGGGGTDFRPPFDHVEKAGIQPCALIYLTDMYGTFPPADPGYPVLWISYSNVDKAPFGTVVMT